MKKWTPKHYAEIEEAWKCVGDAQDVVEDAMRELTAAFKAKDVAYMRVCDLQKKSAKEEEREVGHE